MLKFDPIQLTFCMNNMKALLLASQYSSLFLQVLFSTSIPPRGWYHTVHTTSSSFKTTHILQCSKKRKEGRNSSCSRGERKKEEEQKKSINITSIIIFTSTVSQCSREKEADFSHLWPIFIKTLHTFSLFLAFVLLIFFLFSKNGLGLVFVFLPARMKKQKAIKVVILYNVFSLKPRSFEQKVLCAG